MTFSYMIFTNENSKYEIIKNLTTLVARFFNDQQIILVLGFGYSYSPLRCSFKFAFGQRTFGANHKEAFSGHNLIAAFFNQTVQDGFGGKAKNARKKPQDTRRFFIDLHPRIKSATITPSRLLPGRLLTKVLIAGVGLKALVGDPTSRSFTSFNRSWFVSLTRQTVTSFGSAQGAADGFCDLLGISKKRIIDYQCFHGINLRKIKIIYSIIQKIRSQF